MTGKCGADCTNRCSIGACPKAEPKDAFDEFEDLVAMPEWEFIIICHHGLLSEPHAGCTYKNTYYNKHDIYAAYYERNPGADALL